MSDESIQRLRETNIRKYGSYEAYKEELRKRASKGGKKGHFSHLTGNPEKAHEVSQLGIEAIHKRMRDNHNKETP